jgi:hypothetical protein
VWSLLCAQHAVGSVLAEDGDVHSTPSSLFYMENHQCSELVRMKMTLPPMARSDLVVAQQWLALALLSQPPRPLAFGALEPMHHVHGWCYIIFMHPSILH